MYERRGCLKGPGHKISVHAFTWVCCWATFDLMKHNYTRLRSIGCCVNLRHQNAKRKYLESYLRSGERCGEGTVDIKYTTFTVPRQVLASLALMARQRPASLG